MPGVSDYIRRLLMQMQRIGKTGPSGYEIDHQQKLLAVYRSLLAEYLRQHEQWERTEVPGFLSVGISMLRSHILEVKGRLRGWEVEVGDLPDDEGPDDEGPDDDIGSKVEHQRELLSIHRRTLTAYLNPHTQLAPSQAPPIVINSIQHSRSEIQRIKGILRSLGVMVDDLPEEVE